jgi:cell division protein FtsQ
MSTTTAPPQLPGQRRFALRARTVRRASWWWKLGVPLVVLLVAGGWWFVWSGPVLVLKTVTERGVAPADVADIRAAAELPVGRQMVRLDLASARERVAAIRTVRAVTVSRSWPTGVTVTVTLRTPVAVVKDAAGQLHLADSTGTTYAEVSSAPRDLPLVDADASDPAAVQAVVAVLAALPPGVRGQVSSAQAKSPDSVVLTLGRATVAWGSADETALKASVLQTLRKANPNARHFDLSAPRSPSVG